MAQGQKKLIQTLVKANDIINLLAATDHPMSLNEITLALGWPKSTVHGLLATLIETNLVEQSQENGQYFLGIRLFELGCTVSSRWPIRTRAAAHLQDLARVTKESSFLAVLNGSDSILIDTVTATHTHYPVPLSGSRSPLFCTSYGKTLLAFQPSKDYGKILKTLAFSRYTPYTVSNAESLDRTLSLIRKNGYCIERDEHYIGISSIASPVFDRTGTIKYAMGIIGAFSDAADTALSAMAKQVHTAANCLSLELGWQET